VWDWLVPYSSSFVIIALRVVDTASGSAGRSAPPPGGEPGRVEPGHDEREMSTRRLILTALLCGLLILVAFTVQLLLAA
jgi:hypothetical protein